jgi:hypothetical protein
MKNRFSFLLGALLFTAFPAFAGDYFTTVFLDDEGVVYVGLKHGEGQGESQVISFPFNFDSAARTNYPLPDEISHRDVIGLIPEKKKLFVLTNGSGEKGDGPMLHVFDRKTNTWRKIGKVDCPTFTKVNMKSTHMTFFCEQGKTRKGKAKVAPRNLAFGHDRIFRSGTWRFPEFMLRYKGRSVLLEGRAPTWDKLHIRSEDDERTLNAEDLAHLPLPAPVPQDGGDGKQAAEPEKSQG